MKKVSHLLPIFAIAIGVALVTVTSAFKEKPKFKSGDTTYYFEYQSGDASNPSNWQYTSDETLCDGDGESCKIRLTQAHVNTTTTPVTIDASSEPSGKLPTVAGSGSNLVPDPNSNFYDLISDQTP